jgi:hypothetical protein
MKDAKGHGSNARGTHASGILKAAPMAPVVRPEVLQYIRANPGGFSITPKGKTPDSGYMVSVPGRTKIVNEADLAGPNGKDILQQYARDHADVLSQSGSHFGGWTDKATGKTHLDVSNNIKNRDRAVSAGTKRNQIAIWDVRKNREINTGGTGDLS